MIDKRNYVLEVQDGGRVVKRYPVALGANPVNRKLCQDRASTPEGRFRIINLQPLLEALEHDAVDRRAHGLAGQLVAGAQVARPGSPSSRTATSFSCSREPPRRPPRDE